MQIATTLKRFTSCYFKYQISFNFLKNGDPDLPWIRVHLNFEYPKPLGKLFRLDKQKIMKMLAQYKSQATTPMTKKILLPLSSSFPHPILTAKLTIKLHQMIQVHTFFSSLFHKKWSRIRLHLIHFYLKFKIKKAHAYNHGILVSRSSFQYWHVIAHL